MGNNQAVCMLSVGIRGSAADPSAGEGVSKRSDSARERGNREYLAEADQTGTADPAARIRLTLAIDFRFPGGCPDEWLKGHRAVVIEMIPTDRLELVAIGDPSDAVEEKPFRIHPFA